MSESLFWTPPTSNPHKRRAVRNSKPFAEFYQTICNSKYSKDSIASSIPALLFPISPLAVLGRISNIIVFAFKGKPMWSFPHIGKEVGELEPSTAYGNSTTTVIWPREASFIGASFQHLLPRLVRWADISVYGVSVNKVCFPDGSMVRLFRHGIGQFNVVFSGGRSAATDARYDYCRPSELISQK